MSANMDTRLSSTSTSQNTGHMDPTAGEDPSFADEIDFQAQAGSPSKFARTPLPTALPAASTAPDRLQRPPSAPNPLPSPRRQEAPVLEPPDTTSSLKDGIRRTITTFKSHLTGVELQEIQGSSLSNFYGMIISIQLQQRDQKQMMNLTRIKMFLTALEQFEQVIKAFVSVDDFVAFIWGPIKYLLQVASTWSEAFDTLLDACEQIGEQIPLLQRYQTLFEDSPHTQKVLNLIYEDLMDFHLRAIRLFTDKARKQIFKASWKCFKPRLQHILDALQRHKQLLQSEANVHLYQQYQIDRMQAINAFEWIEASQKRQELSDVRQWLCSSGNVPEYELACKARKSCPGSGSWVLQNPKVRAWKEKDVPSNPVLWMNGIPGAGKSVLASVIIEDCLQLDGYCTAHFYCAGNDAHKNTCIAALRALISQLLARCSDLLPYCYDKFITSGETMLTSVHTARQLLELLCEKIPRIFLIVDGLDECSETERRVLVNYLTSLVDKLDTASPGKLRLLVVSQSEGDIKKLLPMAVNLTISSDNNGNDIRAFVDQNMLKLAKNFGLPDTTVNDVATETCARASGMFLFAKLVMENLLAQPSKEDLFTELAENTFPKGLQGAYERIMCRIKSRTDNHPRLWKAAVKLLGWMTCAKRPLRWYEIQAAASIDSASQELKFDEKKFRFDILDLCGSLVIDMPGNRLALVHSTAKQYILRTRFISPFQVECNLTQLCLEYLTFPAFDNMQTEFSLEDLAVTGQLAFHDYSAANWTYHVLALVDSGKRAHEEGSVSFESREAEYELAIAFEDFFYFYKHDLQHQEVDNTADEACKAFAFLEWCDHIKILWSHSRAHTSAALEIRNKVSLTGLDEALTRSRKLIEDIGTVKKGDTRSDKHLDQYYGKNRFKCPKVTCFWFHEGFADSKTRQTHISRHERPFRCEVLDCSASDLGLKNAKDLEKHTKTFHPSLDQHSVTLFTSTKVVPTRTPYACQLCPKRYTRKFHLTSHIRNHNQQKPFECSECGKAFTRANDCKRHEKIHSRRG